MSELAEQAADAVERAIAAGAGDAEAYASEAENREVRVHGGEVESLTAATQRGLGLRVWIGRRVGYGFGTDLWPAAWPRSPRGRSRRRGQPTRTSSPPRPRPPASRRRWTG